MAPSYSSKNLVPLFTSLVTSTVAGFWCLQFQMCRCRPLGTHAAAPGCPPAHHNPYPVLPSTVLRLLPRHRGASDCLACHSRSHILTVPYSMLSCWAFSESNWGTVTECYGQSELYSAEMFCLVVLGAGYQQIWSLVRDFFFP